jgi:hypothetical protein
LEKKIFGEKNPLLPPMVFGEILNFCVVDGVRGWLKI